ncbi:2,5-diamino-6-(ribosylamino)-4(3H)-pyrimidinone 5'-phosphate reductase [Archaeoglobales archaeon]|nr:MAG: 2,5-diamino-6-(ribosylamino)-4(3H)-pyrimidinone 5'-phosphate reductase [Archaeoglobales archaeon]
MRPFVFINIAASLDGKISDESKKQLRISCKRDLERVDRLRADSDAIMVGIGTILADNPSLTVKSPELRELRIKGGKVENPMRIVVDSKCRTPLNAKVLDGKAKTIVAASEKANEKKIEELKAKGVEVVIFGEEKVDLKGLMNYLHTIGIRRLMVEGGGTLIRSLIAEKLVDEIYIYYGNILVGGKASPTIVDGKSFDEPIKLKLISLEKFGEGILLKSKLV